MEVTAQEGCCKFNTFSQKHDCLEGSRIVIHLWRGVNINIVSKDFAESTADIFSVVVPSRGKYRQLPSEHLAVLPPAIWQVETFLVTH